MNPIKPGTRPSRSPEHVAVHGLAVPKGTRCQCQGEKHAEHAPFDDKSAFMYACYRDAVRLVTVEWAVPEDNPPVAVIHSKRVPMCEPCAAHAEKGAAK
jgi:hypothetical protein